jgi:FMN phosphatase YigB (HAD superfamily)
MDHRQEASSLPDPVLHHFEPVARLLASAASREALLSGAEAADVHDAVMERIASTGCRVLSLDVFDTLLLRNDKPETARYHELSSLIHGRLTGDLSARGTLPDVVDILMARLRGMEFSYRTRKDVEGCREGHIEQVVRVAVAALGLKDEASEIFLQSEIDYEAANLTLNPILADVAKTFRNTGGKVVLVSDMYLGRAEIAELVKRLSEESQDLYDEIFSSADLVVSKRSGRIFGKIEAHMEMPPDAFLHIGDAWEGDVVQPRTAGWNAMHFPIARGELSARTQGLERFSDEMASLGHDLSRWARL